MTALQHAIFAPSSMYPTVKCFGRKTMIAGIIEKEGEEAMEGTAAHWGGEKLMTDVDVAGLVGTAAPNGVIFTEEMYDAALAYVQEVHKITPQPFLEDRVYMPQIHNDCWGTVDAWYFDPATWTLYVWDFKYGHGSVISYENWQLMAYVRGILNVICKNNPEIEQNIKVSMRIVQPRCYDGLGLVRKWDTTAVALRGYVNQMNHACAMSEKPDAMVTSGPHCKHCPGRYRCPASLESAAAAIDYSRSAVPREMTDIGIAYEMQMLERAAEAIKYRQEAITAEAMSRVMGGKAIPGYSTIQGYSNNKWNIPAEEVISLGPLMGVDFAKPAVPKTPTQACTEMTKNGVDPSVIKHYYGKQPTALKLVKDDGSRAKQIFSQETF